MRARDFMTTPAVTVDPGTNVVDIAKLLLARRISAVPVVDAAGILVGMVSEGDLMKHADVAATGPRPWWLGLLSDAAIQAQAYVKQHGRVASEVMSQEVVTVSEDATLAEIARVLEERAIKRVPVVRDAKVVGIVSRANLLQGLATLDLHAETPASDEVLRSELARAIDESGVRTTYLNTIVTDGEVHLWGAMESREELDALAVILENLPGLKRVESHLTVFSPAILGAMGGV